MSEVRLRVGESIVGPHKDGGLSVCVCLGEAAADEASRRSSSPLSPTPSEPRGRKCDSVIVRGAE